MALLTPSATQMNIALSKTKCVSITSAKSVGQMISAPYLVNTALQTPVRTDWAIVMRGALAPVIKSVVTTHAAQLVSKTQSVQVTNSVTTGHAQ